MSGAFCNGLCCSRCFSSFLKSKHELPEELCIDYAQASNLESVGCKESLGCQSGWFNALWGMCPTFKEMLPRFLVRYGFRVEDLFRNPCSEVNWVALSNSNCGDVGRSEETAAVGTMGWVSMLCFAEVLSAWWLGYEENPYGGRQFELGGEPMQVRCDSGAQESG